MKLKRLIFKVTVAALAVLSVAAALLLYYNHRRVGRTIDSYHGVLVYDNGLLFFRSHGRNYSSDGYYRTCAALFAS